MSNYCKIGHTVRIRSIDHDVEHVHGEQIVALLVNRLALDLNSARHRRKCTKRVLCASLDLAGERVGEEVADLVAQRRRGAARCQGEGKDEKGGDQCAHLLILRIVTELGPRFACVCERSSQRTKIHPYVLVQSELVLLEIQCHIILLF